MELYSNILLTVWWCCLFVGGTEISQLTPCSAKIDGKIISLQYIKHSLNGKYGEEPNQWNYTYNPCFKFSKPERANDGFGDKCLAVSLCKYGRQNKREYYYTLGFHGDAEFVAQNDGNNTNVLIYYDGFRSMKGKQTYVRLICDRERLLPDQARFTVLKDMKGLGNVYATLEHVSCCPDGYLQMEDTDQDEHLSNFTTNNRSNNTESDVAVLQDDKVATDRTKVMIIVGVNVGIIFVAGFIGFMCYNKRSHIDFYSKLPGVRTVPDPTLWHLDDDEQVGSGRISSAAHPGRMLSSSVKSDFRDGAPSTKRKSVCFPVLEHCGIPEDCLSLGQRLGGSIFGDTYIAKWTGITVSVKRITLSVHKYQIDKENIGQLKAQVSFLSQQRHRNIVALLGYCAESTHPYIISEYITGQILKDFIKTAGEQLTWPHRVKILSQVADGMAFLHSTQPPILHRDLRCGNLFITNNDVVKICDFGIVNITQPLRTGCQLEDCCCQGLYSACPPWIGWTAPEVLEHPNSQENEGYITTAADVYSYAVVMWELVLCDDPYEEMNTAQEVIDYVTSGGRPEVPQGTKILRPYNLLMTKCWDSTVAERPSFKQITVQLKEILHQAKMFQKDLSQRSNRRRTSSKSMRVSFTENNENA
ncbi:inactive tyrosine-protein kinase 7-like [Ruditapes philippinarum]|uniref:inactive tyrosine-protein kinase 7-like n=1 Tax=Ruditapes philippinarum TaxID=129788 RepID=UPI00295ADB20|nr:inactive tyrosine-protein kinase 7-like [Ruditapes philippinarum]